MKRFSNVMLSATLAWCAAAAQAGSLKAADVPLRTMGGARAGANLSDAPANAHHQWDTPQ